MRQHQYLPAMVSFVGEHVAQHFDANRPRLCPAVSVKLPDAVSVAAERFGEHFPTARGALDQSRAGLTRGALRAIELSRDFERGRGQSDPLGARVVHVREDGRNGADSTVRLGSPGGWIKMLDKHLVHAIVGGEDPDSGSAQSIRSHMRINFRLGVGRRGR
jgi:hypothetical protein